ncbi:MAG: hypothetical protein ACJAW0_001779 [Zhongshania sp.]|jgi:hypothetical protein
MLHRLARDWHLSEPGSSSANDQCGWLQRHKSGRKKSGQANTLAAYIRVLSNPIAMVRVLAGKDGQEAYN